MRESPATALYRDPRRRYALGERPLVRMPADKLRSVVFLVQDDVPQATGFLVGVRDGRRITPYVVTARHCVEETQRRNFHIRTNQGDAYDDIPTHADDWFEHDSADVAAIPFVGTAGHYDLTGEDLQNFIPKDRKYPAEAMYAPGAIASAAGEVVNGAFEARSAIAIEVGHEVVFAGLLFRQPGQQQNLPVARFGHIARLPKEPILLQTSAGMVSLDDAYLVEGHSWGGNSGSPCWWLHPTIQFIPAPDPRPGREDETILIPHERQAMALLGLVSGHWNIDSKAETTGDFDGEVRTAINSGMAIITPAEAVKELLMRDDVVEDRTVRIKEQQRRHNQAQAMTADSAGVASTSQGVEGFELMSRDEFYDALGKIKKEPEPPSGPQGPRGDGATAQPESRTDRKS
jgi:hypothetical protein